ncbi:MFS transporter [Streptomyces sp. S3(2020)]|uniref:MFS transporter n=1 Tax=Streptomyces sp. S3(2020) TaxID=2732044 RepID=UPI001488B8CE|nr:MFS transporter [Streptomyces sp. S3(2020)]NNN31378.1 MFS transporter [Streptomyces sp. S3(2020)]
MEKHPLRWWALAVCVLAVLVDMIDNQIVAVALPAIHRHLGAGEAAMQWISAGYALGFALTLIAGGRLGDQYGVKKMFLAGMGVFTLASLSAGLAPEPGLLIASRVVQGVGSGLMVPQVLSFIHTEFDEAEQPRAMGLYAAAFPLGGLLGPLLGGVLTEADLFGSGWRAIFLVNIPIGLAGLIGALATMPARPGFLRRRLDFGGLALLTVTGFAVFYPLVQGREQGWPLWSILMMAAALPLAGLFALHQRRQEARGGEPVVPPSMVRMRSLASSLLVMLTTQMAIGVFFMLTLYLQLGLDFSPVQAALSFAPGVLGIVIGNALSMNLAAKIGRPFLMAMVAVLAASLGSIALVIHAAGKDLNVWQILGPIILFSFGIGGVLNALFGTAFAQIHPQQAGAASGLVNTTAQVGQAAGIALFGTVFFSLLPDHGYETATVRTFLVSIGVTLVALMLTVALPRKQPAQNTAHAPDPSSARV